MGCDIAALPAEWHAEVTLKQMRQGCLNNIPADEMYGSIFNNNMLETRLYKVMMLIEIILTPVSTNKLLLRKTGAHLYHPKFRTHLCVLY